MVTRPAHYNTRYKFDLSPRQKEVLDLIARGRTNPEIAEALGVSLDGAKYHVREILAKLDVESREEAAIFWRSYNRPMAKLGRAFSGVLGLGTLKAVVGGAAVIGAGAAIAGVIVAINASSDGGSSGDPGVGETETPTATATADVTTTPIARTRLEQFATQLDRLVAAGDVDTLMAMAKPMSFECPGGTPQGLGGPFPLCDGGAAGEIREGYRITRHGSEGEVVPAAAFRQQLAEQVAGTQGLVTAGCPTSGECDSFAVAFDAAPTMAGYYRAFYLSFATIDGEPALQGLGITGDNAETVVKGGVTRVLLGEEFPEVEFKVVR